jgi:hypothetical protein
MFHSIHSKFYLVVIWHADTGCHVMMAATCDVMVGCSNLMTRMGPLPHAHAHTQHSSSIVMNNFTGGLMFLKLFTCKTGKVVTSAVATAAVLSDAFLHSHCSACFRPTSGVPSPPERDIPPTLSSSFLVAHLLAQFSFFEPGTAT